MAYCSQLPPFWRNLYAGLFGLILLVTILVHLACRLRPSCRLSPRVLLTSFHPSLLLLCRSLPGSV